MGSRDDRRDALADTVGSGEDSGPAAVAETIARDPGAPARPRPPDTALPTVPRDVYRIDGEVARGGMGRIVRARDARIGRAVAIKEALSSEPTLVARFEREAVITARLQHPSIVPVYEAGRWPEGDPFYAMKLVAGKPLDRVIAGAADLAARIALAPHVIQVCEALAYAHDRGIVHRDLKPGNVLVGDYGETVVIDWGLAKDTTAPDEPAAAPVAPAAPRGDAGASGSLTRVGAALGTPAYMAPEQARGDSVDARADVYALGALLYHLLAGQMPYHGLASAGSLLDAVLDGPPPPLEELAPQVPRELAAIAGRAMERDPEARYPSARELAADLRRFEAGQLVSVHRYSTGEMIRRWVRRRRGAVATAALLLVVLAVVAVISVRSVVRARDLAEARAAEVLEDQGRQELVAGHPARALPYLLEASRGRGATSPALAVLLAEAAPAVADVVRVVPPAGAEVRALFAAPDGTLLVELDDGRAALVAPGGAPRWLAVPDGAGPATFSTDGARVAIAGPEVEVFDVARAAPVATVPVEAAEAAVDRDRALTVDDDARATLWDLAATPPRAIASWDHAHGLGFAARHGHRDALVGNDAQLLAYDAATGAADGSITPPRPPAVLPVGRGSRPAITSSAGAAAVSVSPDGRWAFAVTDGKVLDGDRQHHAVHAFELATGRAISTDVVSAAVEGVAVSPRGDRLFVWDAHEVAIADAAEAGRLLAVVDAGGTIGDVRALDVGPHGALAVETGEGVAIYEVGAGVRAGRIDGHTGPVVAIAAVDGGRHLATGGADGRVVVWAPTVDVDAVGLGAVSASPDGRRLALVDGPAVQIAGDRPQRFDAPGGVRAIDVAWQAARLAIVDDAGALAVVPMDGGAPVRAPSLAYGCAFDAAGGRVVTLEGRRLRVWAADRAGPPLATFEVQGDPIGLVRWFPDGEHLVTAGDDGEVRVWPAGGGAGVRLETGHDAIGALAVSADGARVAVGAADGKVRIYAASGARELELPGFGTTVSVLAFAPDGGTLAIGGDDGTVRLWSVPDGRQLAALEHGGATAGIAFRDDGALLATASADSLTAAGDVRLWDARTGAQIGARAGTGALAFADGGRALVVRGATGVAVWRLDRDVDVGALAARDAELGLWRLEGGRLVPTVPPVPHAAAPRESAYDFSGDTIEGDLPRPRPVGLDRAAGGDEAVLAGAAELMAQGKMRAAAKAAAGVDGAALTDARLLYVLAYARYAADDPDGALAWARAAADRATTDDGRDAAVTALIGFAPRARAPVTDVLAGLRARGVPDPRLLELAAEYAGFGRVDDAFALLDAVVPRRGFASIDARLLAARIAIGADRPSDEIRYLVAAHDAAAAPDAPAVARQAAAVALTDAIVGLRQQFAKTRDRRYLDADRALERIRPPDGEAEAADAAEFARAAIGADAIVGDRDKAQIRRTFRAHDARIRACYERALLDDATIGGTVQLSLSIDAIGGVGAIGATVDEPRLQPVADCVVAEARTWRFQGSSAGGHVHVLYPLTFAPPAR